MKVHLFARLAVRGRLGRGEGGKDLERRVADGRRQSRFLEQETDSLPITRGCSPAGSTTTRVPRMAPLLAARDVIRTPSMPSRETASWIDVKGTPASSRAPRIMSPLAPEGIEDGDTRQVELPPE